MTSKEVTKRLKMIENIRMFSTADSREVKEKKPKQWRGCVECCIPSQTTDCHGEEEEEEGSNCLQLFPYCGSITLPLQMCQLQVVKTIDSSPLCMKLFNRTKNFPNSIKVFPSR